MQDLKYAGKKLEILKNDNVTVAVDSLGAKVLGIFIDEENLLHYDENDIGHSGIPICLPFFGALKDNLLLIDDKTYNLSLHGFFRQSEFELYNTGKKMLAIFKSNRDTVKIYPYKFNFKITFELIDNGLKMNFVYKNEDSKTAMIAPGFHPYFAVKDKDNIFFTSEAIACNDSEFQFQEISINKSAALRVISPNGDPRKLQIKNAPNLQLVGHQVQDTIIETGKNSKVKLSADMENFSRMTIWRPTDKVNFICIEPSFEVNAVNEGKGISLASKKEWKTSITIQKV